ncbi:MAG TPA: hypothetical protein VMQ60_11940 [Acidobacteriaceae bacterium]|jgi:hypothetical protein|nr:hypothetical protein [Acidobacteriaceae bacterium]
MSQIVTQSQPKFSIHHNKTTDMAFIDIFPTPVEGKIEVIDVSDIIGIGTTVMARFDEEGNLLGLTIENYKHFRRELMRQYLALAVDRIIGLLVDRVKSAFSNQHNVHDLQAYAG